jgi:hypothetical protein
MWAARNKPLTHTNFPPPPSPHTPLFFVLFFAFYWTMGKHLANVSLGCLFDACCSSSGRFVVHMNEACWLVRWGLE